ncbi:MAG: vitamin K epoxide reductase family protein [Candidatus Limnocylindrales bacterium]
MTRRTTLFLVLSVLFVLLATPVAAQEDTSGEATAPASIPAGDGPFAQAVFYFSPACGHCEYVITNTLPGLFADNGGDYAVTYDESVLPDQPAFYLMSNGTLQLLMVDTSTEAGSEMFREGSERLGIERAGVPRIDFNETDYLVGSADIPDLFPGVVADSLAADGMGWPPVPGVDEAIAPFIEEGSVLDPDAVEAASAGSDEGDVDEALAVLPLGGGNEGWADRFGQDVVGNSVSVVVLALLLLTLVGAPVLAARGSLPSFPRWSVIVLVIIGAGVAAYLATVETSGSAAVCGPVGDCNAVQQSEYAQVFGVPVGVLGVAGYAAIGGLWLVSRLTGGTAREASTLLIGVGAWVGTLFSIYLTFLEPFVIGATCMWCISSAVVMMALLWVSAGPGVEAWHQLRGQPRQHATAGV